MPSIIFFEERPVLAKGHRKNNFINEQKLLSYFHDEDYSALDLLKGLPPFHLSSDRPLLFYPGCGVDILFPLHYLQILFPRLSQITFFFVDLSHSLGIIKSVFDDIGVTFSDKNNILLFYWKNTLIKLCYCQGDVFSILETLPEYDIYFEKAFCIMKEQDPSYESRVYQKLKPNGVLISDSGFQSFPLQKIKVSPELSSYREMIIGIKKASQ
ncbi:hypothetical protein J4421_04820 [Candidatus Woesearchaeota archaeon]|nr:hypothetical protein [Candidatus Woesearchaeota archaeon]